MLPKKNILIIGGNGFLGQGILKALNYNKYSISILDPSLNNKVFENYNINHTFKFGTLNVKSIIKAVKTEEWDYIIHLAAFGGKGEGLLKAANEDFNKAVNVNVTGFANLLDYMKNKKTKVIWASSTVVFGEENTYLQKPVNENSILKPTTNYGLTKLMAEQVANFYIKNYNPLDKAGGYGIQDWIGLIGIKKISGSFYNVMGLPTEKLYKELSKLKK